jgi:hypothetical protein
MTMTVGRMPLSRVKVCGTSSTPTQRVTAKK